MLFNLFVCFKGLQGSLLDTLKFNYYSEYYKLHVQLEETQKKHCIQGTDPNKQELSQHCRSEFCTWEGTGTEEMALRKHSLYQLSCLCNSLTCHCQLKEMQLISASFHRPEPSSSSLSFPAAPRICLSPNLGYYSGSQILQAIRGQHWQQLVRNESET